LSRPQKILYSLGAIGTALSYQAFSTYILFFYVDTMKLATHLAAIAMLVYGLWNALNDPLFGFLSDRTRTPFGRRIPYIALGAVPFGIIYFLLWIPPFNSTQTIPLFLYFLSFICLFDGFYSIVVLNWASLYPEMFSSLTERASVNSLRQFFGVVGLIIGISLPPLIYSSIGWGGMGLIFGCIISLAFIVSLLGCREKKELSSVKPLGILQAFSATLKNRSFLTFVISNLFIQYTFMMVLAIIPFYAKYVLGVGPKWTSAILLSAFILEMPMLFVWGRLAVRFGAKRIYMIAIALFAVFLLPFFFLKAAPFAAAAAALLGTALGGVIVLSDVLISDVIDEDEIKTGRRREGMYFGINAFVTRFAIALEAASIGGIFILTGYNPNVLSQTGSFLMGLRFLIAGLPMLSMAAAFVIMMYYPLEGENFERVKAKGPRIMKTSDLS